MSTVKSSPKTIVLFRRNDLDAFYAAFTYWFLFGKDSIRPSDTIVYDGPTINFKSVDPFEILAISNFQRPAGIMENIPYIGTGENIVSIGTNISNVPLNCKLFSYENDDTFCPAGTIENEDPSMIRTYNYRKNATLTELMFESLVDAGHITTDDKNFKILNQFFRWQEGDGQGFKLHPGVGSRVMAYFPRLQVEDFPELAKYLEDPIDFMDKKRLTPEVALRSYIERQAAHVLDHGFISPTYLAKTNIELAMFNSDLVNSPLRNELFEAQDRAEAGLIYHFEGSKVRAFYRSSNQGENALEVFPPERLKIGTRMDAEWLISHQDLVSLLMDIKPSRVVK